MTPDAMTENQAFRSILPRGNVQGAYRRNVSHAARVRFSGDGRIPSGILVASMTGVRLSFRRFGAMPVRCISPRSSPIQAPVLGLFWLV